MTPVDNKDIALFPLNICLLPGEDIPLKIFEPRYKQLIDDCEKENFSFGIPFHQNNGIQPYGTEVKLKQIVAKNSHGEMVIMVECVSNFELLKLFESYKNKLYPGGTIQKTNSPSEIQNRDLLRKIIHYSDFMDDSFLADFKGNKLFPDDIAKAINLSSEDKYKYICLNSQKEKENFLRFNLDYLYKLREQEKLLKNDYTLN